jgi:hypothetical protein
VPGAGPGPRWLRGPHSKVWHTVLTLLGALALVVTCGLSSWFIVLDERQGQDARADGATPQVTVRPRDISSRAVDPQPLTVKEVFPGATFALNPNEPPYKVLKTQATTSCDVAVDGEIVKLLKQLGCNQVVRGTMRSPTGGYLATGGIFNLENSTGTELARTKIKELVNAKKGRFNGMAAGDGTEAVATSAAHVGWDIRGHYLIYCVIARSDGNAFADNDPYARQIMYDIVEWQLRDQVLEKRATEPIDGGA